MCQEHPSFCFSVIQVSLSILAFYAYRHWAIPSLVCDWAFPESGWIFVYWEPGLIPLNKLCSRRTFQEITRKLFKHLYIDKITLCSWYFFQYLFQMRPSLKTALQRNQKKTFLVTQSTNPALSLDFLLGKIINDLFWISVTWAWEHN